MVDEERSQRYARGGVKVGVFAGFCKGKREREKKKRKTIIKMCEGSRFSNQREQGT